MNAPLSLASLFTIEAKEYKNFSFDEGDIGMVYLLVFGICIGLVIASLYTLYQRSVPGALVRALLATSSLTPETAKTLEELELGALGFLRLELRHNLILQKTVCTVEAEGEPTRYYIPEEQRYRAEGRFDKKGNGPLQFVLTVLLAAGLAILLFKLIPLVLSMIDAIL